MGYKFTFLFALLFISFSISAQLVNPGITVHKTWGNSADQSILNSAEYMGDYVLCGYNISSTSGKKTGFYSFFDYDAGDTIIYFQNPSPNTNTFYSVVVCEPVGGSGTFTFSYVLSGYEEVTPGDRDLLIHRYDTTSGMIPPYKSTDNLIISKPNNQEALCINHEFPYSTNFWACGYSESSPGNKDFWAGLISSTTGGTTLIWDTTFGGIGEDVINGVNFYEGSPVFTGYTSSTLGGDKDIFIASLNQSYGIYENTYQDIGDQVLYSSVDIYGNILAVGYSDTTVAGNNRDMLIVCYTPDGYINWTRTVGTTNNDEAFTVRQAFFSGNQYYIVSGYTTLTNGDKQNYVVMLDYWGDVYSQRIFGNPNADDCVNTIFSLPDGCQFYLFGQEGAKQSFNEIVALNFNYDIYDVSCNGANNGEIYIYYDSNFGMIDFVELYDSSFTYLSSSSGDFYDLLPGKYYLYISYSEGGGGHKSGCNILDSVYINEPQILEVTTATTDLDCHGNLGSITATPTGGTTPYNYNWNDMNSQTTATAVDLITGVYNVVVTDYNGCTTFSSQLVQQAPSPSVSITSSTNIHCFGANNGTATAATSGGTPPYTYVWNDPTAQTNSTATNLSAGSFIVSVTDTYGCSASTTISITEPSIALTSSISPVNILCKGDNNGSATVTAGGGTPGYSYIWSGNGQVTPTATNLAPGNYFVTVTDINGCTNISTVTITEPLLANDIDITSSTNVSCKGGNNGMAVALATGGTPGYTYVWNDPLSQTGAIATNLSVGIYVVNVVDNNGCNAYTMVTVTQPALDLMVSITTSSNASCTNGNDGSATVSAFGGTPGYTFLWNDPAAQTGNTASNLTAGNYYVFVSDANNCNASTSVVISQPASALFVTGNITGASCTGNDGYVQTTTSGGTPAYTYMWDDLTTNSNNYSLATGNHSLTVTDANGCTFFGSYTIPYLTQPAVLRGNATFSSGNIPAGEGKATLFIESNGTGSGQFDTLDYQTMTSAGFEFNGLLPGKYFLKIDVVHPNLYPNLLNTYYNSGIIWNDADTISLSCNDIKHVTVQLQEANLNPTGNCNISGNIIMYDISSGSKSLLFTKGPKAVGEPVPGAEILIEQEPNDVPVQSALTNQYGDYVLENIPTGDDYYLIVDIPGYPMLSSYLNISINSSDTLLDNYNFILDTTSGGGILIDTTSQVGIFFIESGFSFINIYPNPVSSFIVIDFELLKENSVSVDLINETGATVKELINIDHCLTGKHNYQLEMPSSLSAGSYFIRFRDKQNVFVKKIIFKK